MNRTVWCGVVVVLLGVVGPRGLAPGSVWASDASGLDVPARVDRVLEPLRLGTSLETGILHDRVVSVAGIATFDGTSLASSADFDAWLQLHAEVSRAAVRELGWFSTEEVRARTAWWESRGAIPLVFLETFYETVRPDAMESGALQAQGTTVVFGTDRLDEVFTRRQAFAFAPSEARTFQGDLVSFVVDPMLIFRNGEERAGVTGGPAAVDGLEIDFADGRGYVSLTEGLGLEDGVARPVRERVSYSQVGAGSKTLQARLRLSDGRILQARAKFEVARLGTPAPDDTLQLTASIPYLGQAATGRGYVYLAPGHAEVTRPIAVVEGFDIDNSLDWAGLYEILNTENLIEDLRALGYDAVVLDFADATDYLQRNGLLVVEMIQQVQALVPGQDVILVGASMGGLLSRYALAYMETHAITHQVPLWISFDAPHAGAAIPLGIQYWVDFFSSESVEAEALLDALNSPAARQLLAYHYTTPPSSAGTPDPLRLGWIADLAAAGGYPATPRRVAIANGSGAQMNQGFGAGAQIVEWEYSSFFVDLTGNVWAVPDASATVIFDGLIDILFLGGDSETVTVSGTAPYDNAPGGSRDSMAQMDAVPAPYGDIVALHDSHCFIPTVSALDVSGAELFEDLAGDPNLVDRTPFDAVYFPGANQEHVLVTPQNKAWLLQEIQSVPSSVPEDPGMPGGVDPSASVTSAVARIVSVSPHPWSGQSEIRYAVAAGERFELFVVDATGRKLAVLESGFGRGGEVPGASTGPEFGDTSAGGEETIGVARSSAANRLPAGVYFLVLQGEQSSDTRKIVVR